MCDKPMETNFTEKACGTTGLYKIFEIKIWRFPNSCVSKSPSRSLPRRPWRILETWREGAFVSSG